MVHISTQCPSAVVECATSIDQQLISTFVDSIYSAKNKVRGDEQPKMNGPTAEKHGRADGETSN